MKTVERRVLWVIMKPLTSADSLLLLPVLSALRKQQGVPSHGPWARVLGVTVGICDLFSGSLGFRV